MLAPARSRPAAPARPLAKGRSRPRGSLRPPLASHRRRAAVPRRPRPGAPPPAPAAAPGLPAPPPPLPVTWAAARRRRRAGARRCPGRRAPLGGSASGLGGRDEGRASARAGGRVRRRRRPRPTAAPGRVEAPPPAWEARRKRRLVFSACSSMAGYYTAALVRWRLGEMPPGQTGGRTDSPGPPCEWGCLLDRSMPPGGTA